MTSLAAEEKFTNTNEDFGDFDSADDLAGEKTSVRKSGESSPTASLYDADSLAPTLVDTTAPVAKEFSFFHSSSHLNLLIVPNARTAKECKPDKEAIYYIANSLFSKKADVLMHEGPSKEGRLVAACKMRFTFGTFNIALGDPDDPNARWQVMQRKGQLKNRHWAFDFPTAGTESKRHVFLWKRTRGVRNMKLVDGETGEIVAQYMSNYMKSWRKAGKLVLYRDYGGQWTLLVLVGYLALLEKARRRHRAAIGGGGSASGGP